FLVFSPLRLSFFSLSSLSRLLIAGTKDFRSSTKLFFVWPIKSRSECWVSTITDRSIVKHAISTARAVGVDAHSKKHSDAQQQNAVSDGFRQLDRLVVGAKHADRRQAEQDRHEISRNAEALKQKIGQQSADEATPIVGFDRARRRVQRTVGGAVGKQAQRDQESGQTEGRAPDLAMEAALFRSIGHKSAPQVSMI